MNDNIKKLYDELKGGGADVGSPDEFNNWLSAKGEQGYKNRLSVYNELKNGGADVGSYDDFRDWMGLRAVKPSKPTSQTVAPKPAPAKPAKQSKPKGTPMTEAERQNMLNGVSGMVEQSKAGVQRTKNRMNYAKANTGLRVPDVTLGVKGGGVHLGQNSKVVETKPQYNAESGKVERSYLTESGNEYKERGGADLEQNAIDEARFQSEQQEAYLLREKQRIEQEMNQRGRELDAEAVDFSWRDMPRGSGGAIHTYNSSTVNGRFADTKYKSLLAQLNKVNDGLATLAEAKKGKASDQWIDDSSNWASKKGKQLLAFGAGAWRGLAHAVGKVSTWDMGMTDMATNGALYTAAVDADRKGIDNISREDRDLLDITAYTNAIQSENEQYLGRGYKAGQVTGESLPFMIEMMLNPASKLGTTATNKLMREAVKRYGKDAVKKATKKYLAAKIGTRLMGDAVGSMAMAGTTGQGHVTADMLNRLTGDVQFKVDDSGKIVYGGREGAEDSVLKAYMKAFGAQTIENHSEMVGEYFAPFLGKAASLTRKGMDKIGLGKVNKLIDDIGATNAAKMLGDFEKQTKWNGTFGEYAEEVVGNIENAILVGDNTLDTAKGTGVFNADQNIDTFLGVSLMGGFFAGAKTLSYRGPKRQALNEMSDAGKVIDNAIGDNVPIMEKWGGWRNTFLVGTDEEKKAALREVMDNTDLPIKFRMGVLNFVKAAQKYEGIVRAQESKVKDGEQDPVAQSSDESYDNGYDTTEPEAMNDAKNMYDYKRQQMSAMVTDEFLADFDNDPVGTLSQVMGRDDFSEDEKQLALDYVNAKATYDGMIDRVRDDIDSRIEESNATIKSRVNKATGMIHPATLKLNNEDGSSKRAYIVSGNVVMSNDGKGVDREKSDDTIIIRDADTGELKWLDVSLVSGLDESIDPATEKEAAQQALREQYAQEQSDRIDGVLAFNVGDTYDLTDEHGQQWSAQIVADNGDGTVQVAWNGDPNSISTARKDELQSMRDNHNLARLNEYEQQRAAQRQEQQAEAAEPQRRTYNLNDEITLRDEEGNPVRGSITAEENEDGEIEVYTEQPINGKQVQLLRRDELDNMLLEQNGEVVEPSSEEEVKPSEASLSPSTPLDEDAASVGNTSSEEGGATLEPASATSEEQHIEEEQHAEPMPMIGEGEDAEPDFASVTPQRAHEYIFNESGLDEEDAKDFMTNNLRAAETAVTKIKNNKPKMGTSIAKFNKNKAEWQQKLDEANANLDYWQQVKAERNAVLAERAKAQQEADKKQTEEAQAAEAAYREEMAKKEAEQAALGTNTVSPAIRDKWNAAPKVEGAQNEIVLANGEKVAGRYYLVESGAATPSHNSANGFAKSEGFPVDENGGSVNDRDYERDKDAQQITRDIANKYDSRAMQTPVVVSQDGVVLSGNGRTMAGELAAAQGTDAEYNEHLAKYPTQYGFTSEQVKGMQHPRVVFVPDAAMPYTADTFAKFNQQEMKGQSKTEHSVKLGKVVDDDTFNRIISLINRFDTLGDFYADFAASREAIGELFKCGAISRPQMAEMVDGDGLSAIGKETLENMLIGKAFESNPDAVREATEFKQMRQTIIQALAEISNNISLGKDYSLESELAEAIDLVYNARKSGFKAGDRVSSYARQQQFDFYGVSSTVADYKNATMLLIADILNDNRSTLLKKYLQLYNTKAKDAANGQLDIFSGTVANKESILNDVNELLNYGTEEEQKKAAQEAVEKRKAESVAEAGVIDNGSEGSNEDNDRIEETPAEQAPTEEEGSKPVMSHDEKMAFMRQFLEDTAGDMRLLDVVTDEEVQKLIDLYDAWEVVNDGLGAAHDANDALLNDKNKAIAQKAKENIETAENAANAAFAPVEDYYNELLNTHNIEDEEGDADETETPSAETPLSDAISAAEAETDQNPTDGQKEAGNYKKGHVQVGTFDITIENPKGSVRRGKDANGKEWESKMNNTYGYFRGTEGVDGDHIDVFLSNDIDGWDGRKVFVVDQYNPDGSFDEHKVMLGFNDADDAKSDYLANYEKGWENGRRIDVSAVNLEDFEKWIASSKRKTKAFSEYKNVKSESADSPKTGAFGTIYTQFKGKPQEAIAFLLEKKEGEAVGALHHKDIGDIDLVWGKEGTAKSDGFGLAKLAKYHPEVLGNLQEILDAMVVVKRTDNRVQLESETHQASVRLTWDSEKKNWLLTAFEKKNSVSDNTTDTVGTAEGGKRNDTATPQNTVSDGKDTEKDSSDQENGVKSFKITPKEYTTKRGKKLSMHLVTFESELSKEQMNAAKKLAKDAKGWWSKEDGGFLMRDMESAQKLADSVLDDADAVADAQPVSLTDMKEAAGELDPRYRKGWDGDYDKWKQRQNYYDEVERKEKAAASEGREPYYIALNDSYGQRNGQFVKVWLKPGEVETIDGEKKFAGKDLWTEKQAWHSEEGFSVVRTEYNGDAILKEKAEAEKKAQPSKTDEAPKSEPKDSGNKLVTDERYAELKARMRKKLGQLNVGVDPEMLAIGTEMAVYHIEKGARKFTEYAKAMIEDLGEAIRPYLKAFYNGARDLPEVEANGWSEDLTPYDEVRTIDIANFDKPSVDAMATAEMVVKEHEAEQQAEETKKQISETRNKNRNETKQQTAADTQAITSEATAIASETESVIRTGEENAINEQVGKIDEALDKVNNQLALLGFYEADEEEKDYNEATGYMRNAERKAVKDAGNLASRLIDDLGLDRFEATHSDKTDKNGNRKTKPLASANIAPVGGDVSVRLPLEKGRELYLTIGLEPRAAKGVEGYDGSNLEVTRIVYRVENPNGTERYGNNKWVAEDITYADLLKGIQYEARDYLPKRNDTTAKKPKASKKVKQEPQIGDLFASLSDNNVDNNEETNVQARSSKEGGDGQQRQQDAQMGGSAGNEAERTDGRGMGGRDSRNTESDGTGSKGLSRLSESKQGVTPAEKKNVNNNHAERGKDYAPKGADARIDANIKAIELMQKLMQEGKQATPAQMKVLRQFSGWGGLGKAFVEKDDWRDNPTAKRLKELLGDEAYAQAEMSRNSAYYTPASVIDTMWDIARALGFKGGKVLEGSAGIGNIIGAMPTDMSERSNIQAVEIDETTGNILSLLYPDAKVDVQGFEATRVPNGSVDLAITNVPFVTGLHVSDETGDNDLSKKFRDIHDFCIAKNVRKLREGGIGIFITSNGTLDSSQKLRNWLVNEGNADVIGAFRLNNQTFGGTGATSDIIVIRKRVNGKKSANAIDVSTVSAERAATFEDPKTHKERTVSMDYNKYFIEHPECMAGEMRFGFENKDFYRPTSKALYPVKGKNQNEMLAAWMKTFEGMKEDAVSETTPASSESAYEDLGDDVKEGSLVLDKDDKLCIAQYGKAVPLAVNANKVKGTTKAECFRRYQAIKGTLADVLSYQTENESDNGLQPLLDKLNDAFDSFVKTYGHLHKNKNIAFLKNDVDFPTILALEKYSEVGDKNGKKVEKYDKTDIFSQRVVEKEKVPEPKNVKDGIIASIYQYGRIDVPYIADKLGKSEEEVKKEIVEKGLGYENPATMQMDVSYEYLSGNVREKLKQAEEANTDGKYSANVEALRKVIPMDIPSHLIEFTLGSSWVDPKLYTDYIKERTDVDVQLTNVGGTWFMKTPSYTSYEKNKAMGVRGQVVQKLILGTDLIEAALQNKTITVSETHTIGYGPSKKKETITDKEATQACSAKIDEIRADFKEWARQKMQNDADMSERIERTYNEQFNNYVPLTISDEFVPEYFGGANHKFKMRPHQAKAIIRGTMQPLLLAHEVGTGKTFTLISTAMEMRRLGTAKKPMIVVQNATVGQFVASAKELYPNAKVLTLEDKDRKEEGRKNFYAKIKYNDWDMIVVPQSVFERIPDSEERQMRFIQDKIDEKMMVLEQMREADSDNDRNPIIRQAEKEIEKSKDEMGALAEALAGKRKQRDGKKEAVAKQNASVKAKEMLDRQTDDVEDFDDMGIDALLVDEAHEYKHLGFATAMQRGVKGIDPSFSKKSQGVYLKTQAVLEKNNGRNVIFATGTPISNTAAEIWTFMRYLMPADAMKEYGIYYFDDFVRNFGNLTQMLEFKTDGKFQEVNRFAGYVNLPELVRIWSSVADTVRTDEAKAVKDNVPDIEGGQAQDIYLPQTRALRSIMKFVKEQLNEYNKMSGKEKKENSYIPLTMYGIAKAAAVDARLVMADAEDDKNSKTNEAVRQTLRSLKETAKYNGTIALFADVYQNKHTGFNLYEDIRKKLIEQGVPAEQVVIIRSDMTIKKKQEIFDKVNRGEIRVIMGSTFTLGTGVNIQERLHTLIHLDAPNRPMDYTQRNGRIARQGNLHKVMGIPIRILRFGVQDSLDVTAYQRLKTKGAIADSIMKGKSMLQNSMEDRSMEEDEDVFGDTVAQLSGSQYAMLKNQAEREVRKYESKKKQWEADQTYVHNAIPRINREIERAEERAATAQQQLDAIAAAFGENATPAIKVGKKTYADINAMSDLFADLNKKVNETAEEMRKSSGEDMRTRKVDVQIGDVTFTITTTQKKELVNHYGAVDTKISRSITYSCPELGLENEKGGAWFKNAIEDIFENVVSGDSFREELTRNTNLAERMKGELEQVKSREGQPFQYDKELSEAYEHLEEYTELMKKELEEKEQKYAEMDSEVEAATGVTEADEADEDTDDDKRFRDSLPDATAEDKDLRYSLREQTAPKHTKTAYAVFIVKQHEDGSVTLHPKMIADEAVGAPPHTWLNADTGKIKRDKQGEPIQNTRGRVSVRDAKGAPLAWRPGKHLAAYPNASQFAVEGDTKGVRDRLPDNVVFFEVEYAADRDYQLEAWEYGVNGNGKYEHSQAGLPYIPKDGYYIYRTNANPNIPAMIITGAYRVKRALTDEEAKKLNQEAGGDWYDRKSGEPMTAERLKELGLDEAGLQRKAETFDYNELEPAHDESSVAMSMPGYVRRDLDFTDKNLLKAIKENKQDASYYKSLYEQQKKDERQREQTAFEDGQVLPIELDWRNGGYKVEGLNAIFANKDRLLDAFRTKYESYVATMTSDGNAIEVSPWRSVLAETKKPRRRNGKPTKAEQAKAAFVERQTRRAIDSVNDVARKLGLNVEVKTDTEGLTGRRARAKGWYDTKTGKIAIILPNHTSGQDVMRTILHEGVAHHGLRELFGEDFDTFLENVYNNASKEIREAINRLAAKNDWDFKVATEEYLAGMAEDTNFDRAEYQSWWGKIKFLFLDMLRKAGLVLNRTLTDADLRYILWRSYENLKEPGRYRSILGEAEDISKQMDLKVGNFAETDNSAASVADGDSYMYRDGDVMDERDRAIVRDRYERTIQSGMYQFREAVQDSMLSLRRLMEHIAEATGEKVKDFENAYMAENALSSKNHAEQDIYGKLLFNPMLDELHNLAKENSSRDEVTRYMMAKHGLERNEVMARRAAEQTAMDELGKDLRAAERAVQNDPLDQDALDTLDDVKQRMQDRVDELYNENRERDYGGITGLMGEDDLATAESLAKQFVLTFEGDHDVDQLWGRVNACTKATLEKTYKAGLLSKAGFDEINSMYEYYIPLRGFDATTSDEVYSYLTHEKSGFSSPLKKAEGRKSIADDPIATIANMADCAIVQSNRNMMKQKFLKFAMNHPSDAVSINKMWLRYDDVQDQWEAVTANIDENDSADDVLAKTEAFEEQMRQLAESDPDHYKRGKDAANIPYIALGKNLNEHQVHVKMGGEDYILTINGSPRVAQALNGLTNPDNENAGEIGELVKAGKYINRQMSAFYTTRNPEFVLSNFLRDALYANSTMWVRETPNYAIKFNKNFLKCNPAMLYKLLQKHNSGTLDMNNEMERAFHQFMMNGGETGYTVVKDIEKQKKLIKKYVRMKDASIPAEAAWKLLGDKLDDINRSVENCARFAAYLTSRQMGRSVERSVWDAKEVSVNFNKKGAGAKFLNKTGQGKWYSLGNQGARISGIGRSFYVFWNAAVQGTTNFASLHKHHTAKALAMDAGLFLLGAMLAGIGGGDDDEYWNLPSYVRRSNICFKIPGTKSFCSIPLGIEQRAIYGLGELFSSLASGKERMSGEEIAKEIAGSLSSMMPLDFMEDGSSFMPSYLKPFTEAYISNKDWKGMPIYRKTPYNEDDPEWTKASKRTNQLVVDFSKWCNEVTGGDDVKRGWANWNPSKLEHLFEGVFGGISTTANKMVKAGEMVAGKQDFDWSNILLASRVIKSGDENAAAKRYNAEYWKYCGEYRETKRLVDHYENQDSEGIIGAAEKLDFMYNSPEYGRYEIVDEYYYDVKEVSDELKETTDDQERKELEAEINTLKQEMVMRIRAFDDARKK
jgi:N12 class adenine-specific DNA methylase